MMLKYCVPLFSPSQDSTCEPTLSGFFFVNETKWKS